MAMDFKNSFHSKEDSLYIKIFKIFEPNSNRNCRTVNSSEEKIKT